MITVVMLSSMTWMLACVFGTLIHNYYRIIVVHFIVWSMEFLSLAKPKELSQLVTTNYIGNLDSSMPAIS